MPSPSLHDLLDFDIDRYLNPWIPRNQLHRLPKPVARWLGYRSHPQPEPPAIVRLPITFIATVGALCLVPGITNYAPGIASWNPPVIVASLGASAVLDFNAIRSPLTQPRNAILGTALAAICGVAVAKLFQLHSDFQHISWVSGAVGCAVTSLCMSITGTVYPPGGATAILASTQMQIVAMGWRYVPLVLLGTVLMTSVALIFNNIFRQYPVFWWTPDECGQRLRRSSDEDRDEEAGNLGEKTMSDSDSDRTFRRSHSSYTEQIVVSAIEIRLPPNLDLHREEEILLRSIQSRLFALNSV